MKQPIRLFSLGLITSGILMLVIYFVSDSPASPASMTEDEMIAYVEGQGFEVMTNEQYITLSVTEPTEAQGEQGDTQQGTDSEEPAPTDTEETTPESTPEDETAAGESPASSTYTLNVEEGMFSGDISTILEQQGVIDSATEFDAYLEEHDYSSQIQLGTFELSSAMTHYELAERLTN